MMPAVNSGDFGKGNVLPATRFNKQQKIGLSVLLFFTILVMVFWYWQLQTNIVNPLYGGVNPGALAKQNAANATATSTASVDNGKDTDGDGLTDWQEINIYHTSPYLADTDGDGIPDGVEVKNGTDPNCPQGKVCAGGNYGLGAGGQTIAPELLTGGSASTTASSAAANQLNLNVLNQLDQAAPPANATDLLNQLGQQTPAAASASAPVLNAADAAAMKKAFGANPDPKVLRQKFLAAATNPSDQQLLTNMTDTQLLQVYQTMIGSN